MYDFNSIANRLMQADFDDFNHILDRFLNYLSETEIISDFIADCGKSQVDLEREFKEIGASYGRQIFSLGDSDEEEVGNVFAILNHISQHNIQIHHSIAMGYAHSRNYQDMVKGFNERVTYVLIHHIERYLTKIGIEMGMDEKNTYNITVEHGQVNIASDNAMIEATSTVTICDNQKLNELIDAIRDCEKEQNFSEEEAETLDNSLKVISDEMNEQKPKAHYLKMALNGLKAIKGTAEFGAAVVALIQYIQPFLS